MSISSHKDGQPTFRTTSLNVLQKKGMTKTPVPATDVRNSSQNKALHAHTAVRTQRGCDPIRDRTVQGIICTQPLMQAPKAEAENSTTSRLKPKRFKRCSVLSICARDVIDKSITSLYAQNCDEDPLWQVSPYDGASFRLGHTDDKIGNSHHSNTLRPSKQMRTACTFGSCGLPNQKWETPESR